MAEKGGSHLFTILGSGTPVFYECFMAVVHSNHAYWSYLFDPIRELEAVALYAPNVARVDLEVVKDVVVLGGAPVTRVMKHHANTVG